MDIFQLIIFIRELNAECFCKSVTEVVAGTGLQCLSVMHQRLDGVGGNGTCKFLFICLASFDNRNSQYLLTEVCINIQHLLGTCLCLFLSRMYGMSFLPQELSGAKERSCGLLPTEYRTPLVIYLRKISVGMNLFLIEIAEQSLGSRTYTHTLLQRFQSAMGNPCYFRSKSFYMVFLFLKQTLRNQHRQIYILYPCLFESAVKFVLDVFPDCIASRFDYHASLYAGIITQLCFLHDIGVPLGEIHVHGSDAFY